MWAFGMFIEKSSGGLWTLCSSLWSIWVYLVVCLFFWGVYLFWLRTMSVKLVGDGADPKQNKITVLIPPIFLDILLFNWLCWRWCLLWDHEREKTVSFFSLKCVQKIVLDTISLRREKLPSVFSLILIFCFLCTPPPHATFLENNKINNLLTLLSKFYKKSFPGDPDSKDKESTFNTGGLGSIPGLGRCPLEKGMATHFSILAYFSCTVDFGCHLCILSPISDF